MYTGREVIKNNSCSTQLSVKFFLLINVKMPTIVPRSGPVVKNYDRVKYVFYKCDLEQNFADSLLDMVTPFDNAL